MTTSQLARRTFLKGLGLSVGLPLLESLGAPRTARGNEDGKLPVRMACLFFPNGAIMPSWTPDKAGHDHGFSPTLKPLEDMRSELLVLTGLAQDMGRAHGDGAGDHARCAASYLTGAHPVKTSGANIRVGISVDQAAAEDIGHLTKLPSLELGIERGRNAGSCDSGYSCAYSSNVSWKSPTTPMAKEIHPRLVFERMFGGEQDADRSLAERNVSRRSILDFVAEDAAKLRSRLGQTDRRKLDEYFTSVRELEQRIERSEQETRQSRPEMDLPDGVPRELQQHIRLMYDLLVLAFRTDTTRVATFMLANAGSNRSYPMVGVNEGHHQLSHHQNNREKIAKLQKIDEFLVGEFAYFLRQLQAVPEGEGTLLDQCMVLYGSGLSDGNRHWHHALPILLAGRGGHTIHTGQHLRMPDETPLNNLFLSMLDRVGADVESIGDSSGRLTAIDA